MPWHLECVQLLTEELKDTTNSLTKILIGCSEQIWHELISIAEKLLTGATVQSSCANLDSLLESAYKEIISASSVHLSTGWIRIYTDGCILRSLADVGPHTAVDSIAKLDGLLITCGSASGRVDFITSIITNIQRSYLTSNFRPVEFVVPSPDHGRQTTRMPLHSYRSGIAAYSKAPSLSRFQSNLRYKPFVIRGYASDWPAVREHPWGSAAYLRNVSGPARIVPVEVGKDYRRTDWTQELMSWDDFLSTLDLADQTPPSEGAGTRYLAQHDLSLQFPSLRADIIIPDYVYASVATPELTEYQPPRNEEGFVINMWLGPEGTMSPAHTDPYHNLFAQIVGRKTVWLAPPNLAPYMYTFSLKDQSHDPVALPTEAKMINTSRVDVFSARADEFSQFWQEVVPEAESAILEPGDLLYIPPGWWHALRSESTSFSVSIWF